MICCAWARNYMGFFFFSFVEGLILTERRVKNIVFAASMSTASHKNRKYIGESHNRTTRDPGNGTLNLLKCHDCNLCDLQRHTHTHSPEWSSNKLFYSHLISTSLPILFWICIYMWYSFLPFSQHFQPLWLLNLAHWACWESTLFLKQSQETVNE